jgi:hypothetical protein
VKKIDTLKAYIKFGTKLFHLTWEKRVKYKIGHGKSEEKGEFGNPRSETLWFKEGTPIMLGPHYGIHLKLVFYYDSIDTNNTTTNAPLLKYYYSTMLWLKYNYL